MARAIRAGRIADRERAEIARRITFSTDLHALGRASLVIEAIFEDIALKADLFAKLEGLLPGTDLEIFGVTMAGVPVRLDSSYNSGTKVWTWRYDPGVNPYVEYTLQPKVSVPARPVRGMMR